MMTDERVGEGMFISDYLAHMSIGFQRPTCERDPAVAARTFLPDLA